jgi:hypothetical protein
VNLHCDRRVADELGSAQLLAAEAESGSRVGTASLLLHGLTVALRLSTRPASPLLGAARRARQLR